MQVDFGGLRFVDGASLTRKAEEKQKLTQEALLETQALGPQAADSVRMEYGAAQGVEARMASGTTYYHALAIGQGEMEPEAAEGAVEKAEEEKSAAVEQSAEEEFLAYMEMTPEERILQQILKEEGMTREQFNQLPQEDQRKILAKVKERLELMLGMDEQAKSARLRMGAQDSLAMLPDMALGGAEKPALLSTDISDFGVTFDPAMKA